jgi:uncharacterized membrane protein (UPF0127 family)
MIIKNKSNLKTLASKAFVCKTLLERYKGLMFKKITHEESCILESPYEEDMISNSIHMMFVPQDLDIIWVNENMNVVSVRKCKKASLNPLTWRTYSPAGPSKYVIELLDAKGTIPGDKIQFIK